MRRGEGRNLNERREPWESARNAPENDPTVNEFPDDDASDQTGDPVKGAGEGSGPDNTQGSGKVTRAHRWLSDHILESVILFVETVVVIILVALMVETIGLAGKVGKVDGQIGGVEKQVGSLKDEVNAKLEGIKDLLTRAEPDIEKASEKLHEHDLAIQENKLKIENLANILAAERK